MPVHDGEAHLGQAIESILGQTFTDLEFLIIDDGSTDGTPDVVAAHRDRRIRFERLERRGFAGALNFGLGLARGDYVVRMDSDDVSTPDRITSQVRFMDQHPELGASGTFVRARFDDGRAEVWRFPCDPEEARVSLLFEPPVAHPSAILRRELLERHGIRYDPAQRCVEDWDLWLQAARCFRLGNLPRPLLDYRVHEERMSSRRASEQRSHGCRIQERLLAELGLVDHPLARVHGAVSFAALDCADRGPRFVEDVAAWFGVLRRANRGRGSYAPHALDAFLARRLLLVLGVNPGSRRTGLRVFFRDGWHRRARAPDTLVLVAKSLLPSRTPAATAGIP
jgi:glycosyltransferase involved in cell wall biosynthesis